MLRHLFFDSVLIVIKQKNSEQMCPEQFQLKKSTCHTSATGISWEPTLNISFVFFLQSVEHRQNSKQMHCYHFYHFYNARYYNILVICISFMFALEFYIRSANMNRTKSIDRERQSIEIQNMFSFNAISQCVITSPSLASCLLPSFCNHSFLFSYSVFCLFLFIFFTKTQRIYYHDDSFSFSFEQK